MGVFDKMLENLKSDSFVKKEKEKIPKEKEVNCVCNAEEKETLENIENLANGEWVIDFDSTN